MSERDNPYAGPAGYGSQYGASGYGAQTAATSTAPAAPVFGAAAPAKDLIKDTTTAKFAADVIQESKRQAVLVDFWAPWCGPCKQLTPALEKAVAQAGGKVKLVKMNIDEHPSIAGQLGIQSIPAVIAFRDGKPVDGFMGAIPESQIRDFIARVGGAGGTAGQIDDALAAASEARTAGDPETAAQIFSAILEQAPENVPALTGLGDLLFENGEIDAAEELLERVPDAKKETPAVLALKARIALQKQVGELGDPAALQRRLADDPKDYEARFDLAKIENALGNRDAAADHLLAIVKADRAWKEDGARAQLLQFFEAWGMTDPATLAARRKLSSLLFS